MDPVTAGVGISAASGVWGAIQGDKANKANYNAQQQRQAQIDSYIQPYLQQSQGENPYAAQLMQMMKSGAFQGPATQQAFTYTPSGGTQGFNTGQDSYMQMLRTGGQPFDTSKMFSDLAPVDNRLLEQQLAQSRGATSSLGQRFGGAQLNRESNLRRDFLQNVTARNAGIQQGSYESAQQRVANAALQLQQGGLSQMGMFNQAGQFNAGQQAQAGQFNVGVQQGYNQFLASILGQAGGLQAQQRGQQAQLLAIMAGQPAPQQQPSQLPGAIGDAGNLAMFLPFLQSAMKSKTPTFNPTIGQNWRAPMPSWF